MIYKPHFEKINTSDPSAEILKLLEKYSDNQKILILETLAEILRKKNSIRIYKGVAGR